MTAVLAYGSIAAGPLAAFWIGFWFRGVWDKAGRDVERLASLNGPVSDAEWAQIVATIKEST